MSVETRHITKLFGKQKALDEVTLSIKKGELVGFLGPNGAGKSTMMKIITGYIDASEGAVIVNNFDIFTDKIAAQKSIGYLPEHNPLYLEMYVREYLEFIAGIHKVPNSKARIDEMIELVGLTIERKKKIGALSKGYRQRVGLAQAMIHDPEVLILDEPTAALNEIESDNLLGLIRGLKEQGITSILISHKLKEVIGVADVVIDFTLHDAVPGNALVAESAGKAIVIGATGLGEDESSVVSKCAEKVPIVWAPNMSLGVNVLFAALKIRDCHGGPGRAIVLY